MHRQPMAPARTEGLPLRGGELDGDHVGDAAELVDDALQEAGVLVRRGHEGRPVDAEVVREARERPLEDVQQVVLHRRCREKGGGEETQKKTQNTERKNWWLQKWVLDFEYIFLMERLGIKSLILITISRWQFLRDLLVSLGAANGGGHSFTPHTLTLVPL